MRSIAGRLLSTAFLAVIVHITFGSTAVDAQSSGTYVQGGHSAAYFDIDQSGHGFFVEVLDDPSSPTGKRLLVAWYAFFEGRQIWLLATGHVVDEGDGQVARMTTWIYEGNDFPPDYDPFFTLEIVWGEMVWWFIGCDQAVVQWDSVMDGYGAGELELRRLTTISGTVCDPDFGGDAADDDHGNVWQTATWFPSKQTYNDVIEGNIDYRGDVDVFLFEILTGQNLAIFTISSIDTIGTLYRLEGNSETELEMNDNHDDVVLNFTIVRDLAPGTYTIHVEGARTGGRGAYSLWIQTNP